MRLTDDRVSWTRKVEIEGELGASEVVQLETEVRRRRRSASRAERAERDEGNEHELLGQQLLVFPDAAEEESQSDVGAGSKMGERPTSIQLRRSSFRTARKTRGTSVSSTRSVARLAAQN